MEFNRTTIQSWSLLPSCKNPHTNRVRFRDCRKALTDDQWDYPLEILVYDDKVKIKISYDCPRAESIEQALKINVPFWLRNRTKSKEMEIEVVSFYEENIKYYLEEE